jgi:hypothetical protein
MIDAPHVDVLMKVYVFIFVGVTDQNVIHMI